MRVDIFASATGAEAPYLIVRYGRGQELPAHPDRMSWRYLATLRPDLDSIVRIDAQVIAEVQKAGFTVTWRSPF